MADLVSPNELFEHAKQVMLAGRDPVSKTDWTSIFHYFASKIVPEANYPALKILRMIFDAPLTDDEVKAISNTQLAARLR